MKITDASMYVNSCLTLEQMENQKILIYISAWLDQIKKDVEEKIFSYYTRSDKFEEFEDTFIPEDLSKKCQAFKEIIENFQYVPIQPPFFTLKTSVDEITRSNIPDELKIRNIIFKNISEFNFTESLLKQPNYERDIQKSINNSVGSIPVVHSMTVTYHFNPLMWPLIFHEYGHSVFHTIHTKSKVEEKIKQIRIANRDPNLRVNDDILLTCISEVYSDLFALNYYSKNYFLAFYFHEMLASDLNGLFNLDACDVPKRFQDHPPSIVRMKYLYDEMKKKNIHKDEIFKKLEGYNKYLLSIYPDKIKKIPELERELYGIIYQEMSSLFDDNVPHKFDFNQITKMNRLLQDRLPIGTMYKDTKIPLKTALSRKGNKNFDLETENKIIDIIYAGWKYVIVNLCDELYSNATEEKIEKFSKDYSFFIKNISYSIETSVIVSSYLRDSNAN